MELIIAVIGIGLVLALNVIAIAILDQYVRQSVQKIGDFNCILIDHVSQSLKVISKQMTDEHKKTRKETQEIKSRLTQVRKDLNKIERKKK